MMQTVAIVGTDERARLAWEAVCLHTGADVAFFIDDDPRLVATGFMGCEVRPISAVVASPVDAVIIAGPSEGEWIDRLSEAGVPEERLLKPCISADVNALARMLLERLEPAGEPDLSLTVAHRTVGIFGTGQGGMKVWEALLEFDDIEPVWFADNNPTRQGHRFLWLEVISPSMIPNRPVDVIVIASMYRDAIRGQLAQLGLAHVPAVAPDVRRTGSAILEELRAMLAAEVTS